MFGILPITNVLLTLLPFSHFDIDTFVVSLVSQFPSDQYPTGLTTWELIFHINTAMLSSTTKTDFYNSNFQNVQKKVLLQLFSITQDVPLMC